MSVNRVNSGHVHHTPAAQSLHPAAKPPTWMTGLKKLLKEEADNLDHYELLGPDATEPDSAAGKKTLAGLPAGVRDFFKKQQGALPDNDGTAGVYKFDLKEVAGGLSGAAYGVRWTSEDQSLDRLFIFDHAGRPVAKGSTDNAGDYAWTLPKGPFQIDDTPHR